MIFTWLAFSICGLISFFIKNFSFYSENIDNFAGIMIIFISFFLILDINKSFKKYSKIILLSYILRISLLFWDLNCRNIFVLPNSGMDTEGFEKIAELKLNHMIDKDSFNLYTNVLANLYSYFGVSRIIGQYLNILLSMSTMFIFLKIIEKISLDDKVKYISMTALAFAPTYTIMSSILLRESLITFLITCSLFFFISWLLNFKMIDFIIACCFCYIASMFHSGSIAPVLAYMIFFILYDKKQKKINFSTKNKILIFLIIILFIYISINLNLSESFFGKSPEKALESHENQNGGSTYIVGFNVQNKILNLILNSPIRIFYFLFSPMPWDWRGLNDIFAFIMSSCFYGVGYILAYQTLKKTNIQDEQKQWIIICLVILFSGCLIFSWGVSNAGTAMRHREKFIVPYVLMLSICVNSLKCSKNNKLSGNPD